MKQKIPILFFAYFLILNFWMLPAEEKQIHLNFVRRHIPGSRYTAEISGELSVSCLIKTADNREKEIKNSRRVLFNGEILIEKCDESNNPSVIKLSAKKIEGSVGENTNFFKKGFKDFSIIWKDDLMHVESNENDFQPSSEEINLLSIIFRSPKASGKLEDIFGESIKVPLDDEFEWHPPTIALINAFRARQLFISPDNISSKAIFKGISNENSIQMANLESKISINGIENFSFDYTACVKLPVNSVMPPVDVSSHSIEKIIKKNSDLKSTEFLEDNIKELIITINTSVNSSLQPCQNEN